MVGWRDLTGMVQQHAGQSSCVSGISREQVGHGAKDSSSSVFSGFLTMFSILRLYATDIALLYIRPR